MLLLLRAGGFRCPSQPTPCLLRKTPTSRLPQFFSFSQYFPGPFLSSLLRRSSRVVTPYDRAHPPGMFAFAARNYNTPSNGSFDPTEAAKREKVSKRLESAARYLRQLGRLGFWGQLVCTVVAAAVLAFSVAVNGMPTSKATFYLTAGGLLAAFLSVFWSFGYIRLSEQLRNTLHELRKAPPRAEVANTLKRGIIINLLGMGSTLLGLEGILGSLVAEGLTSRTKPYLQILPAGHSPIMALDVFLVQASVNTALSHFLGCVFSLELLRAVTLSKPPPASVIPKTA